MAVLIRMLRQHLAFPAQQLLMEFLKQWHALGLAYGQQLLRRKRPVLCLSLQSEQQADDAQRLIADLGQSGLAIPTFSGGHGPGIRPGAGPLPRRFMPVNTI